MIIEFCAFVDSKKRVDIFLSTLFTCYSRSYIQKLIDTWNVFVNSFQIKKNVKINNKDEIKIIITPKKLDIEKQNIPLDIIYEDDNIIVINKDAWISSHPTPWENWKKNTIVNAILYHTNNLGTIWWVERPWIVHRLDKDTSWVMIIAKNDYMMQYLQDLISKREKIWKYYLAIVYWIVKEKEFKIESYIWRHPNDRTRMTIKNPVNPKLAVSYVKVLDYIDWKYTLLEVKIETWRTHQIRVHLSSIWYPIIGDKVYWNERINKEVEKKYLLKRQALHSYKLEIDLYSKKKIFIRDLKDDMKRIIKLLPYWKKVEV